ncbi:MAG: hypothetical protein M3383_03665 [Actinomycetota bacterium]|nr:hypothetical protein [Actinomycetota bacterium]
MNALVVGHVEPAAALTSALIESGLDAELHAAAGTAADRNGTSLAKSMVEFERRLIEDDPALGIAVGLGDAPLALTLGAAKLGIPLVAWVDQDRPAADEAERAEARIMLQLADLDAGPVGAGTQVHEAARRIRDWVDERLGRAS